MKNYNYDTDDSIILGHKILACFGKYFCLSIWLTFYYFVPENLMNGDLCMGRMACRAQRTKSRRSEGQSLWSRGSESPLDIYSWYFVISFNKTCEMRLRISTYPCQSVGQSVQWVIDIFRFGDSYCISELWELVPFFHLNFEMRLGRSKGGCSEWRERERLQIVAGSGHWKPTSENA